MLRRASFSVVIGVSGILHFGSPAVAPCASGGGWREHGVPPGSSITFATFFAEMLPGVRAVADDFHELTGIRVHAQAMPYAYHQMWLRTQFLTRTPPEVLMLEGELPNDYGQSGLLINFDGLIDAPNPPWRDGRPWGEDFRQPLIQQARDVNGDLWFLPYTQYGVGFFYNADTYEELGLSPPATWEDLLSTFRAVRQAGEQTMAVAIKPNDAQSIWAATLILESLTRPLIPEVNIVHADDWEFRPHDPDSTLRERIDLTERIIAFERGLIDPARSPAFAETARIMREFAELWRPDFLSLDGSEVFVLFSRGIVTHTMNGTWYFQTLLSDQELLREVAPEAVFNYETFAFPELTSDTTDLPRAGGINQNAGMRGNLVVPRQQVAPWREEAGLLFVRYITQPEVATRLFEASQSWDICALEETEPRSEAVPLLPESRYAFLPVAMFDGYDNQSREEFWTSWQLFLGGRIDKAQFLEQLSAQHRRALARLARIYTEQIDTELLMAELGRSFP